MKAFFTLFVTVVTLSLNSYSQIPLTFENPVLESGIDKQVNAVYRFTDITTNTDALVKIDSLVNGAEITLFDEAGVGYDKAFQPKIKVPEGTGTSYAVFSVTFVEKGTSIVKILSDVASTSVDIDGNANVKEFCQADFGGGTMEYMIATPQISVIPILTGFRGINVLGIEFPGIDTSALVNMFTVKRPNVSGMILKAGSVYIASSSVSRQHSFYMKGFHYNALSTLPVKFASFTATLNNNKTDLKWTTASEINVSHFIVEKSTDGINYSDAGMVFANGNATDMTNYSLSDNISGTQSKIIYYRLRSIDVDGKSELSATRIIRIGKQNENSISIVAYPNPVSNEVRITIPANWQNKNVTYELFSANGQPVKKTQTTNSSQTETLNLSTLAPGFYVVRVNCEGQIAHQKIVKQ